jgi:predicted ATP-dependent endonuclease of OLD family
MPTRCQGWGPMRVIRAHIAGYRSIREPLDIDLDEKITVILGANDHGKTNVLSALQHLNPNQGFDPERDLNWDYQEDAENFPETAFVLAFSDDERKNLRTHLQLSARRANITALREELEADLWVAEGDGDSSKSGPIEDKTAEGSSPSTEAEQVREGGVLDLAGIKQRLGHAYAEELRLLAEINDEGPPDFSGQSADADSSARSSAAKAKRARTKATSARTAVPTPATPAKLTEQEQKLENEARAAELEADAAAAEAEEGARVAKLLRSAAEMDRMPADGKHPLARDPRWATVKVRLEDIPDRVTLRRKGLLGALEVFDPNLPDARASLQFLAPRLPRVELFKPVETIPDSATKDSITAEGNDFMRGIFWYAGLTPDEWPPLFKQTDVSTKRLHKATSQLNETLTKAWSQGTDLEFRLDHRGQEIDLQISDPAVTTMFVRASRRSSGFTHFFALKTMLYARERASNASSFLWLFDEPGIFLHPEGQHDLLQVLETLAQANQIAYVTHSIFLTNKNYPTRHRLLVKGQEGTKIDQKPFAGQWRAAIDALGLAFPGTFLFASKILLVEGDSDPIFLYADVQKLIELGELGVDINGLSIMSTGNSKHADALIRIFEESALKPEIALLFDGDKGGDDRYKYLKKIAASKNLPVHQLDKNTTVEDHLLVPELFRDATVRYLEQAPEAKNVRAQLEKSFAAREEPDQGLAKWAREEGKRVLDVTEEPSAVGIAREYTLLVSGTALDPKDRPGRKRALKLARKIADMLKLPMQTVDQEQIVEPDA